MDRRIRPLWRAADIPEIRPTGDVTLREPREGWSPAFYESVLQNYCAVRGSYPRTARMHPSTALRVAPADRVAPQAWPISDRRRPDPVLRSDMDQQCGDWHQPVRVPLCGYGGCIRI